MFRKLLFPFSLIYFFIIKIRNICYDKKFFKQNKLDIITICVGNITIGGTGKTPHVEYLIKLLKNKYKIAVLSRGYKRQTRGFLIANNNSSYKQIGDESLQIKQKFSDIIVAVDENRVRGVKRLISLVQPEIVILDDAFQHRSIIPSYSIVLIDFNRPVYKDSILPMGSLREPISSLERADMIIITKCPINIDNNQKREIINRFALFNKSIFFTYYSYLKPVSIFDKKISSIENKDVLLITGIANTKYLKKYISAKSNSIKEIKFGDHHKYNKFDVLRIIKAYESIKSKEKIIVTTEKDAVKLRIFEKHFINIQIYYIPITVKFIDNSEEKFIEELNL